MDNVTNALARLAPQDAKETKSRFVRPIANHGMQRVPVKVTNDARKENASLALVHLGKSSAMAKA